MSSSAQSMLRYPLQGARISVALPLLWLALFAAIVAGCSWGPMPIPLEKTLATFFHAVGIPIPLDAPTQIESTVVLDIRLPRVVLAVMVGAALAVAGALMQGLFRNPLADPGIVGVASGGSMGAATMIVVGNQLLGAVWMERLGAYAIPLAAMGGALVITYLIYKLSSIGGHVDLISMLLIGIAINALGGAYLGVLIFGSTDEELRTLTFWGLGSLARADWQMIMAASPFLIIPLLFISAFSRSLNAMLLGEDEAEHLGIPVSRIKRLLIVLTASLVGASVALTGAIGFIALVVPHIVRSVAGPEHRFLLPASALLGAILLVFADVIARSIVAPAELPIGILTALLGAPVFLSLLIKRKKVLSI